MTVYRGLTHFDFPKPINVHNNPFQLLGELSDKENRVCKYTRDELLSMRENASDLSPQELALIKSCSLYRNHRPANPHVHELRTHGRKHRREHSYARQSPVDKQRKIEEWFLNRKENQRPDKK